MKRIARTLVLVFLPGLSWSQPSGGGVGYPMAPPSPICTPSQTSFCAGTDVVTIDNCTGAVIDIAYGACPQGTTPMPTPVPEPTPQPDPQPQPDPAPEPIPGPTEARPGAPALADPRPTNSSMS